MCFFGAAAPESDEDVTNNVIAVTTHKHKKFFIILISLIEIKINTVYHSPIILNDHVRVNKINILSVKKFINKC
jgi:hypothetical protein